MNKTEDEAVRLTAECLTSVILRLFSVIVRPK